MVSAIIPAHNESKTISKVISIFHGIADEVVVVDSCSNDDTAILSKKCGARVIKTNRLGKHYALKEGVIHAKGEELIFIDGDWVNPDPKLASLLLEGLRSSPNISISKAYYDESNSIEEYGRLTELCARPLINLLIPTLSNIRRPLSGEFALRKEDILDMPFSPGFAVDLGILIHCSKKGRIHEVQLPLKIHKHRSIKELNLAAIEVAATILNECGCKLETTIFHQYIKNSCSMINMNLQTIDQIRN